MPIARTVSRKLSGIIVKKRPLAAAALKGAGPAARKGSVGPTRKAVQVSPRLSYSRGPSLRETVALAKAQRLAELKKSLAAGHPTKVAAGPTGQSRINVAQQNKLAQHEAQRRKILAEIAALERQREAVRRRRVQHDMVRLRKVAANLTPVPPGSVSLRRLSDEVWEKFRPQLVITANEAVPKARAKQLPSR